MQHEIDVKALRRSLGLSQEKFAHMLGVTQSAVSLWEKKGLPNRGTTRKLIHSLSLFGVAALQKDRAA